MLTKDLETLQCQEILTDLVNIYQYSYLYENTLHHLTLHFWDAPLEVLPFFTQNHLTVSTLDLEDNGIGPHGMKYFKNVLHENKHLTELVGQSWKVKCGVLDLGSH